MPSTFNLHEIAAGVWSAVAPGTAGPAVSNAAIIDLGDKTVVVDTFMTVLAADELRAEVERLTGRVPYLVVNSHWHSDHVRGNQVFAEVPIVGTRRMKELIADDAPKTRAEYDERVAALRSIASSLDAGSDDERRQAEGTAALAEALAASADGYQLTLPDVLIGDRLEIEGERSMMVLGYGPGHTESDLFVHLPDDGVIVAGDLVWTAVHPKTNDGFPAEWAAVLDRMAALRPTAVASGHGPPGTLADVTAMATYLRELDGILAAVRAGDADPQTVAPPSGSEAWEGIGRFRTSLATLAQRV